jgi:hypothetical protein
LRARFCEKFRDAPPTIKQTDSAALVQLATDMDDLALQFDGTDAGKRFIEAWKRARIIVDTGGGHSGTPPTPPTPPATPKP